MGSWGYGFHRGYQSIWRSTPHGDVLLKRGGSTPLARIEPAGPAHPDLWRVTMPPAAGLHQRLDARALAVQLRRRSD